MRGGLDEWPVDGVVRALPPLPPLRGVRMDAPRRMGPPEPRSLSALLRHAVGFISGQRRGDPIAFVGPRPFPPDTAVPVGNPATG